MFIGEVFSEPDSQATIDEVVGIALEADHAMLLQQAAELGRRGVRGRSAPQPPSADGARLRRSAGTGGRQRFRLRRRLQAFPCGRTIADGVRSTRYIGRAARARDRFCRPRSRRP